MFAGSSILPRVSPISAASAFSCSQRASSVGQFLRKLRALRQQVLAARGVRFAGGDLAIEDRHLGVDQRDPPLPILDRRRHRRLAHATRAQAVSIRLTALSGNWRDGM